MCEGINIGNLLHKNIYSQSQHFNIKHCIEWWHKQEEGGAVQLGRPPVHGPGHRLHWPALHLHRAGGPGGRCTSDDMCRTLLLRQQGYRTALLQLTGPGLVTLGAALVLLRLLCCAAFAKPGQAEVTCVVEQTRVYLIYTLSV